MSQTCCFRCCTVGTGTLIIGILSIIASIIYITLSSIEVSVLVNYPDDGTDPNFEQYRSLLLTIKSIRIFMLAVFLILSCLLVHGYRVRDHRFIMPWLIWSYVGLGLVTVGMVLTFFICVVAGAVGQGFLSLAVIGLILAVETYFVFVVKRFVDELKGGSTY